MRRYGNSGDMCRVRNGSGRCRQVAAVCRSGCCAFRTRHMSPLLAYRLILDIDGIQIKDGFDIRMHVVQRRGSHDCRMHTGAQRELQGGSNGIRRVDEGMSERAHATPVHMQMRLIRRIGPPPYRVGNRPLGDDPEAAGERQGNHVFEGLLIGDVDAQLNRLKQPGVDGPKRRGTIAAITDIADLSGSSCPQRSIARRRSPAPCGRHRRFTSKIRRVLSGVAHISTSADTSCRRNSCGSTST